MTLDLFFKNWFRKLLLFVCARASGLFIKGVLLPLLCFFFWAAVLSRTPCKSVGYIDLQFLYRSVGLALPIKRTSKGNTTKYNLTVPSFISTIMTSTGPLAFLPGKQIEKNPEISHQRTFLVSTKLKEVKAYKRPLRFLRFTFTFSILQWTLCLNYIYFIPL